MSFKRNLVELNYEATQWKHKAVWTRKYMEAKRGHGLLQNVERPRNRHNKKNVQLL